MTFNIINSETTLNNFITKREHITRILDNMNDNDYTKILSKWFGFEKKIYKNGMSSRVDLEKHLVSSSSDSSIRSS